MKTFDQRTIDSTGSFLIQQLEQIDPTIHDPLQDFTWSRDINVRTDVSMGHDFSSFTNSAIAGVGGIDPTQKSWVSKDSTTLPSIGLDIGKTTSPLIPWGMEIAYTVFELQSAQLLSQPLDQQKFSAMQKKLQQDTDIQVYLGDTTIPNCYGLWNSPQVTNVAQVAQNAGETSRKWKDKTPDEILADVNELLISVYTASAFTRCPSKLALPPSEYALLVSRKVSDAGNVSIMQYLKDNSIALAKNGKPLEIVDQKWLIGTANDGFGPGQSGANRMVAYSQEYDKVRFPMVPMQGLPLQFDGIHQKRPYFCKLGVVEFVYPETIGYRDGIG